MIFKPKISHQKPIKPPLKADFNAYFTKKRMIFTPIYKICATPKGPLWVRFPPGVPFSPGMLTHTRSLLYSRRGRRNNVTRLRLAANNRCSVAALLTIPAGSTIFAGYADAYPIFCVNAPRYSRGVYTIHIHRLCRWICIYRAICRKNSIKIGAAKSCLLLQRDPLPGALFIGKLYAVFIQKLAHGMQSRRPIRKNTSACGGVFGFMRVFYL